VTTSGVFLAVSNRLGILTTFIVALSEPFFGFKARQNAIFSPAVCNHTTDLKASTYNLLKLTNNI
jgi:hypothetical protein